MENNKKSHTPGPWTLESDGALVIGGQVVSGLIGPDGSTREEKLANNRLISAASELLEALKDMVKLAERLTNKRVQPDHSPAYRMALAAIAKAEGRAA